jgi:hypothetical protein
MNRRAQPSDLTFVFFWAGSCGCRCGSEDDDSNNDDDDMIRSNL